MKEITITVNDKKITAPEGTLLIDACEQHGIIIPRFCYHKHLLPSGNCRMCLVEIEKNPKPVPSCMTPITEGMVVQTETPRIKEMRKAILEFILINHPLDCPICDKAGECMLQDQFMEYSGEKSRFVDEKVPKGKMYKFSDRIIYDAERCITCTRCVRFTRDVSKSNKLGVIKRGDRSYVALAPGDTFEDPYSYCVTDVCPVGALTSRQFRFQERVWNLKKTDSICTGCARGCNISIQHYKNKILRVMPRFNAEVNQEWMCDFGRDFMVNHSTKSRLTGFTTDEKSVEYEDVVKAVAEILKQNAAGTALIVSSHATNEELTAMSKMCEIVGIKQIFTKADREVQPELQEVEQDNILIQADKTPNSAGVKKAFPNAKPVSALVPNSVKYILVWGPNTPTEALGGSQIILLSAYDDKVIKNPSIAIAGRIAAEKSGSFTNCDGKVQRFKPAIKGTDSVDDLKFISDLFEIIGQ